MADIDNTFSIVIPVYSGPVRGGEPHFRAKTIQRAIKSVLNQQYPHWELIVVDDGCVDGVTPDILDKFAESDPRIKVYHKINENRAVARNYGMERATKDWICWMDSDDEYSTHYLRELNQAINDFPDYKIFNFGSILYYPDHNTVIRPTFKPAIEGKGHEWFVSGHIGAGSFIFRKDLWESDKKYRIPDQISPYGFAALSMIDMRNPDRPELFTSKEFAEAEGGLNVGDSLGNPWGDDYCQFYYLTRDNHSKPLDVLLYIQYPRSHEEIYKHFGEVYEVQTD